MKRGILFAASVATALTATNAFSRGRDDREGFNFGARVRILGDTHRANANGSSIPVDSQNTSSTQSVSPHIGYAVDNTFNLGVFGVYEKATHEAKDSDTASRIERMRTVDTTLRGMGLLGRFLFAEVLYFELGLGLFDQSMVLKTEDRSFGDDASFSGSRSGASVRGVGAGAHVGAGLEIPVTHGFHFVTAYLVRQLSLRDFDGSGNLGAKRMSEEQHELSFGLHYYQD